MSDEALLLAAGDDAPPVIHFPPPPRAALPPLPSLTDSQPAPPQAGCWAQTPYLSALVGNWGAKPDARIHRGNFFGHRAKGLTEGGESADPELTCTWDWPRYSPGALELSVASYWAAGYTHPVYSRPQCLNNGWPLSSLQTAARASKSAGMFNIIVAISDGAPFADAIPWLDVLHGDGLVDEVCVCWQADRYYSPVELVYAAMAAAAWAHPKGITVSIHWMNAEACAWWNPADDPVNPSTCRLWGICDRWTYQQVMCQYVDFHHGQANTEAPIDALQAWIHKVVISLQPNQAFVASELEAQAYQDNPYQRLESYGDEKGLLCCCVESPTIIPVTFLNGARLMSGAAVTTGVSALWTPTPAGVALGEEPLVKVVTPMAARPPLPAGVAPNGRPQIAPNRFASHPAGVGHIEDW